MKNNLDNVQDNSRGSQGVDPGSLLLIIYSLIIILFLLIGTFAGASASTSAETGEVVTLDDVKNGELLIALEKANQFARVPLVSQKVELNVAGMVLNALVKQRFKNDSDSWIEAVYAFPLPDESAVQHMQIVVGERVVIGEVKEKKVARETYERAKREGRKTSLLVQKRPNIFTMAVANIPPHSSIEVEFEYVDMVRFTDGIFSLRFPLVVGPRYIPGAPAERYTTLSFDEGGWASDTDQVADASQITPPVVKPGAPAVNAVELTLNLSPGFPVQGLTSLYHGVNIDERSTGGYTMTFTGQVFADRDFVVEYGAANTRGVAAALFSETRNGHQYQLLMLMPPIEKVKSEVPREVIFVLDISGSMAGSSIRQAKEAMQFAISRLHERDRFNVIVFNNSAKMFFSAPVQANQRYTSEALRTLAALKAEGGTEIASALNLALDQKNDHSRIRQIVFLTDGAVGNERALFSHITARLGDSRLFTVGIGSAPNSYFMTRAASVGRGTYTYIGKVEEVNEKMTGLFEKLEHPVVSDLQLELSGKSSVEMYPQPLADLYSGEPMIALLRSEPGGGDIRVSGVNLGNRWSVDIDNSSMTGRSGIAALWARRKIRSLMESLHLGAAEQEVRRQVVASAIEHHLVSRYTSLVAVEQQVSRPSAEKLQTSQVKTNLPKGWQYGKVFGGASKTATRSQFMLIAGGILVLLSCILLSRRRRP